MHFHHQLDTSGLICPEPIMLLHNKIREMNANDIIKVTATDPSTKRDIPKFCTFLGHHLLSQSMTNNTFFYFIQKMG